MCGILCILGSSDEQSVIRKRALVLSAKQRHRGPDWSGVCVQEVPSKGKTLINVLAHERLAIVGTDSGAQPLYSERGNIALAANGEIYNHVDLRKQLKTEKKFETHSDCEVIVHMYEEIGDAVVDKLDGMFAFVLADKETGNFLAARDPIGIIPLYYGLGKDGSLWFSSEMKSLCEDCERFEEFPPGHLWSSKTNKLERYYNAKWVSEEIPNTPLDLTLLKSKLENAVVKSMMTDVPYGVLLSGGLDSSLIASIACNHALRRVEDGEKSIAWFPRLHSFSIGLKGAPDLKFAREVSDYLGTVHHEYHFTVQEGLDALRDVIYHIETYDVTSIRASTPMYFLARKIKAMGVKMVLSGEGSDEIFGGYLYFHKAPSPEKFHVETCHKLKLLSKYDCLRANKSTCAWGLEARPPFLDKEFLDVAMSIDPKEKMITKDRMEKYIIRKAFDVEVTTHNEKGEEVTRKYLPDNVLWRQKEQFSDGVGYSWIDSLRAHAESEVSDEQFKMASFRFPYNTPATKEAYYYRSIFHSLFPQSDSAKTVPGGPSIACSTAAAIEWEKSWKTQLDPSGRAVLGVHENDKKIDQ